MPNWCYNSTTIEVDNDIFYTINELLTKIKFNKKKIPKELVNKITNILFNYNDKISEETYIKNFVNDVNDQIYIGGGECYFDFDSKWGPPTDIFKEYSNRYPFIKITNEYYSNEDDYEGTDVILNGKFLVNESFTTSEKKWEENGKNCKKYLLDNIISDTFEITDDNDVKIKFKNIDDIKKFCKEKENEGEDPIEIIFEELDIYTFMNDFELDNCEDNIREVFEEEILK